MIKITEWHYDSPWLPIEFKRISQDGRLTLVISPGEKMIKTFYAVTEYPNIREAVNELAKREGCPAHHIGYYCCNTNSYSPESFAYKNQIKEWYQNHNNFDAILWTNLPEKLEAINPSNPELVSDEDILQYLNNLEPQSKEKARGYIKDVPELIEERFRRIIGTKLNQE